MDLNRLTQKSQEALAAAQDLATRAGHTEVDGEHLLLALLDRITELETALRIRGRTEPVRPPPGTEPTDSDQTRSTEWT